MAHDQSTRDAARALFMEDWTLDAIAKAIGTQAKTVGKWARDGDWERDRAERKLYTDNSTQTIMKLIARKLELIELKSDVLSAHTAGLKEKVAGGHGLHKDEMEAIEAALRSIDKGDMDGLQKLYSCIKSDALKWQTCVRVMTDFGDWLTPIDRALAKQLGPVGAEFLQAMHKRLGA